MPDKGYTIIPDWMLGLGLDIWETIILAVIYGFSQDGESSFTGSQKYLVWKAHCSKRKVASALAKLVGMGLVSKDDIVMNGVKFCRYRVTTSCIPYARDAQGGIAPGATNILYEENIEKRDTIGERFDFKSSLLSLGVTEEVADAWLAVRKNKRATNTEIAFRKVAEEIKKSGKTANECITIAVENSWQGFNADWLKPKNSPSARQPRQKETVFQRQVREMDKLFGTNNYEKFYGNGRADADEQ